MKLLGQLKPKKWPLKFFKRPILRRRLQENGDGISGPMQQDAPVARVAEQVGSSH